MLYAVSGEIKYENVSSDGYLEMWSVFPPAHSGLPEERYFSRTLGESGPSGKISGTSSWREFSLPFNRTGASNPPTRLELNIYLPGRGVVFIAQPKLNQF